MSHARPTPMMLVVLAATVLVAATTAPAEAVTVTRFPAAAGRVAVRTAEVTAGVNLAETDAAAISGIVRAAGSGGEPGAPTEGAVVTARDAAGRQVGSTATTRFDGSYTIVGLPRSARGFAVCLGSSPSFGGPAYGYAGRCFGTSARYLGAAVPSRATPVRTVPGHTHTRIDLVSTARGAVRARVVAASAPRTVTTLVFDLSGRLVASRTGRANATGLPAPVPAGRYRVCVDARRSAATAGLLGQCYGSTQPWVPGRALPRGARTVVVGSGAATPARVRLVGGAAVAGFVTTTAGQGLPGARVVAYASGSAWGSTVSLADGSFLLRGLPAGAIRVCSAGGPSGSVTTVYPARCAPATVITRRLHVTSGVHVVRVRTAVAIGSVAGAARDTSGGLLAGVSVTAYDGAGRPVAANTTLTRGQYVLAGLRASARGYRLCFSGQTARRTPGGQASATGYETVCRSGVTVAAGHIHRRVDVALRAGGRISGRVTYAGAALLGAAVYVVDAHRTVVRIVTTGSDGRYAVNGLTPSAGRGAGYAVCAIGGTTGSAADAGARGYRGRCTGTIAWDTVIR